MHTSSRSVTAPRPIEEAPPYRFPLITALAPVVGALVLFAVTGSSFALVFAALGPLTAIASLADSRWGARRLAHRERGRFSRDLAAALERVDDEHVVERAHLDESHPSITRLIESRSDPGRWRDGPELPMVRLGRASRASSVAIEGAPPDDERFDPLRVRAALVHDAPLVVDARLGIGIVGGDALGRSLMRSALAQLARALSPARWRAIVPEDSTELRWMRDLPHSARVVPASSALHAGFESLDETESITVVRVAHLDDLPIDRRVVVTAERGALTISAHPDPACRGPFVPEFASRSMVASWAARLCIDATRGGLVPDTALLPDSVELSTLLDVEGATEGGLSCVVGVAREPVAIDLVRDGPHAVIGGTTGSGKSELLVSWVLALAYAYPPSAVTVLLVDFKGGSAFAALERLPHTVGVITDLDAATAARALASLRAELRYRERLVARAGARDISGVPELARLVIVVDEFAAMLAEHPDLHALFADIAARGRSLGVHLILCTQRPSGIVRDAVLANADLRISLRVNNRADSVALIGNDSAANIDATALGRGVVVSGGAEGRLVQFALARAEDEQRASSRWPATPVRRPWCEPLPSVLPRSEVPSHAFGLLDQPELQRRELAVWRPLSDGAILVLGAQSSGKSTALAALAHGRDRVEWLSADPAVAWDVLADVHDRLSVGVAKDALIVVDDADAVLARFSPEHRAVVVERLVRIMREGARWGIHVALGARRVTADLQSIASLASSRLLLSQASRHDWVLAGGDGTHYVPQSAAGSGVWGEYRVQVVLEPVPQGATAPPVPTLTRGPLAVVAAHPATLRAACGSWRIIGPDDLAASPLDDRTLILGDPDEWQSRWGALQVAARTARVLIVGCSTADFRALTRSREVPPPLSADPGAGWLVGEEGKVTRARLTATMDSAQ